MFLVNTPKDLTPLQILSPQTYLAYEVEGCRKRLEWVCVNIAHCGSADNLDTTASINLQSSTFNHLLGRMEIRQKVQMRTDADEM